MSLSVHKDLDLSYVVRAHDYKTRLKANIGLLMCT